VLAVNQDVAANPGKRIRSRDNLDLWVKDLHDGSKALALFNRSGRTEKTEVTWRELGLAGPQRVRDLWQQKNSWVAEDSVVLQVPSHGAALLRLTADSHTK
jgi:alpha-galactosidase